jgi:hypothetical protein
LYHVSYRDFRASACGLDPNTGAILYAATARGVLEAAGGGLLGTLPVYCQTAPPSLLINFTFQLTYNASTDTFTDSNGVVWYRQ